MGMVRHRPIILGVFLLSRGVAPLSWTQRATGGATKGMTMESMGAALGAPLWARAMCMVGATMVGPLLLMTHRRAMCHGLLQLLLLLSIGWVLIIPF